LRCHFYKLKTDHFTKTGSGQALGKLTRTGVSLAGREHEVALTMLQQWILGRRASYQPEGEGQALAPAGAAGAAASALPPEMEWLEDEAQRTFCKSSQQLESRSVRDDSALQKGISDAAKRSENGTFWPPFSNGRFTKTGSGQA
jgi:hypothetical protein